MMSTRWIVVSFYAAVLCLAGCENKKSEPKPSDTQAPSESAPAAKAEKPPEAKPDASPKKEDEPTPSPAAAAAQPQKPAQPQTPKPAQPASAEPQWDLPVDTIDFGTVWAGVKITKDYHFKNVGGKPLNIIEIKPHCSCSAAENYTKSVPPGGDGVVPFNLITNNKNGPVREYLDVTTNDPNRRVMRLWLTGTVMQVANVEVIEDSLYEAQRAAGNPPARFPTRSKGNFGNIERDTTMRRVLKIINTSGTNPLQLTMLPLRNNVNFDVEFEETVPGLEWKMTIEGHGPFAEGYTSAAVQLRTNIKEQPFYRVPISAKVPPRIEVRPPKIVIDRKWIKASERLIQITNNGDTPFHITGIECTEPRFNLEMIESDYPTTKTYRFKMVIPSEDYVPPPYGELIRIHTDDAEKPLIELYVLPTLRGQPTPRPADKPAEFHPGKMLP